MAKVTYENATKRFGDIAAVSELSLDIHDGELMVLVGPSGSGKTTALRMLAGLESISSGHIWIGDKRVDDLPPRDRDIAMVFQDYALYPQMSVRKNLAFGLQTRKVSGDEIGRRVTETAAMLGLEELLDRKPRELSGGQRQRVALGRALIREPKVFLMDEPLSNLDAKLRVQTRVEIARIQGDLGVTTVYVTHDQTEAMTLGDRVAVMRGGELQQVGAPKELYETPANLFVGGFIGSPAMNLLEATLERDDGGLFVRFAEHRLRLDDDVLERRSGLERFEGRQVMLGIRPEAMEDASLAANTPRDRCMSVTVELREDMGSDVYAYFNVNASPVITEETRELVAADSAEDLEQLSKRDSNRLVARLSAQSKSREGEPIELFVDTKSLSFFDPETHEGIYGEP